MSNSQISSLTDNQSALVRLALLRAFGGTSVDEIMPIGGGASTASTFRIEVRGRRYLLRVEGEPSPLRNPHQYAAMRIAAEAGIAPTIRYVDEAARVAMIDFIAQQPLSAFPGGPRALARSLGELLSRVQATSTFPYFVDYPDIVARLFAHVRRTGLFAAGRLDAHVERLEMLRAGYDAPNTRLVSSHNDPIPSNVLFDGERLWLIDWESAYRNDPLIDVSIMLDCFARSPELEGVLLAAWLGRVPDQPLLARLALVRALTRLYYAGVLLSASAAASWIADDTDLAAPTLADFQRAVAAGQLKPGAPETKHILGKMFLQSFLTGGVTPGFDAAV